MKRSPLLYCSIIVLLLLIAGIPAAATPAISGVSPSSGPNNAVIKLTIRGQDFNNAGSVWMTPSSYCEPSNRIEGTGCKWTPTSITCDFSLKGKEIGPYTLWVRSPIAQANGDLLPYDAPLHSGFLIFQGTGTVSPTATTKKPTVTKTVTTEKTSGEGDNSVFFETNPDGATIFLNGIEVGMSTFTYYTTREGVYDVAVKKNGYQDYAAKVVILEGKRVHFYAPLAELAPGSATPVTTSASGTPEKNVTSVQKSTLKIPTPLGTFDPVTEESPADPAIALLAAGIMILFVLFRRR